MGRRILMILFIAVVAAKPSPRPSPSQMPGEAAPREWKDIPLEKQEILDDRSFYDARIDQGKGARSGTPHG